MSRQMTGVGGGERPFVGARLGVLFVLVSSATTLVLLGPSRAFQLAFRALAEVDDRNCYVVAGQWDAVPFVSLDADDVC